MTFEEMELTAEEIAILEKQREENTVFLMSVEGREIQRLANRGDIYISRRDFERYWSVIPPHLRFGDSKLLELNFILFGRRFRIFPDSSSAEVSEGV